jgi:hypothetical protein
MSDVVKEKKLVWSSFWLDDAEDESYLPFDSDLVFKAKDSDYDTGALNVDILKLASGRRAIANFVSILTGEDIPVYFWSGDKTGATDGKVVYLSANIVKKEDFDPAVGLALHESSHIIETDFELIRTLWGRISELYKLGKEIGINKDRVQKFAKLMVNYVDDRFIDDKIFRTAPGYRPYYVALYEKYFNNEVIGKSLQSELLRQPTLPAYECRIINLTNPATDLKALPGLRKIAEELSLKNIGRLKTTKDRIKIAVEITKIVFTNIKEYIEKQKMVGQGHDADPKKKQQKYEIYFDIRVDDEGNDEGDGPTIVIPEGKPKEGESEKSEEKSKGEEGDVDDLTLPKNPLESEDDVIGGEFIEADVPDKDDGKGKKDEKNEDLDYGDLSGTTKKELKKIKIAIDVQKQFLDNHGNVDKKAVSEKQQQILDAIEKSGIVLVPVGHDLTPANTPAFGIDCVVVKKMTKELIFSDMFPLRRNKHGDMKLEPMPNQSVKDAVIKGIQLGTQLGKKLQLRQEVNSTKYTRRLIGKHDKRLLHEFFWGNEAILHKIEYEKYNKLNLHISVDSSGSMSDAGKWEKTMTMVVALAKAGSMINNLRVCISFRTTIEQRGNCINTNLPYIVLAYDSEKDKFSKVRNLFPFLNAGGATPEGLCFEAISDELICRKPGEIYYFLTISDGEPCYSYYGPNNTHIDYNMTSGAEHTRKQYNKIIQSGVKGIAYFIKSERPAYRSSYGYSSVNGGNDHVTCFKKMYGKNSQFIDINSVTAIARTMNGLFLNKD